MMRKKQMKLTEREKLIENKIKEYLCLSNKSILIEDNQNQSLRKFKDPKLFINQLKQQTKLLIVLADLKRVLKIS